MDSTNDFVKKFNDTKKKDKRNKQKQGNGDPAKKLPSKRH
ncbi:DUF4023 domain-containing protein [Virgibacillus ainsalahensis]